MSEDPLVSYFRRENQSVKSTPLYIGIGWILLNAVTALSFRFWVVDNFQPAIIEHKLWPSLFVIEGLVQLAAVVIAYIGLARIRRSREFWVYLAATTYCALIYLFIVVAWAAALVKEYQLLKAFALYGTYLLVPAILFAFYAGLMTPRKRIWIYATCLTVALKTAVLIAPAKTISALSSYALIIALALGSLVVLLRFGTGNVFRSIWPLKSNTPAFHDY